MRNVLFLVPLVFLAAIPGSATDHADPRAFVGAWEADLTKSTFETGPKPERLIVQIKLVADGLVVDQEQTFGVRKTNRSKKIPLIDQEGTVALPQGIEERWQTSSPDVHSIESNARVIQNEAVGGWRSIVLKLSPGGTLVFEFQIDAGKGGRFTDRLFLTRVKEKKPLP